MSFNENTELCKFVRLKFRRVIWYYEFQRRKYLIWRFLRDTRVSPLYIILLFGKCFKILS